MGGDGGREAPPQFEEGEDVEELPLGYSCEFYRTPDSMLVRGLANLMALNGIGAAGGALYVGQRELTKLYDCIGLAEATGQELSAVLLTGDVPAPVRGAKRFPQAAPGTHRAPFPAAELHDACRPLRTQWISICHHGARSAQSVCWSDPSHRRAGSRADRCGLHDALRQAPTAIPAR